MLAVQSSTFCHCLTADWTSQFLIDTLRPPKPWGAPHRADPAMVVLVAWMPPLRAHFFWPTVADRCWFCFSSGWKMLNFLFYSNWFPISKVLFFPNISIFSYGVTSWSCPICVLFDLTPFLATLNSFPDHPRIHIFTFQMIKQNRIMMENE